MKKIIPLFALLLQLQTALAQKAFYVDAAHGNNINNGLSPAKAWKTIQKAADSAKPGSTVYILKGVYKEKIEMHVTGTAAAPITFRNYNNDSVFVDGTGFAASSLL